MKNLDKSLKAVALDYDNEDSAPRVIAKGQGELAQLIIERAKKSGVPIYQDERVTEMLLPLPLDLEIPFEAYEIVSKVYVFLSKLEEKQQRKI